MESKTESSSQLITRRDSMNPDDTMQDADEETFQNHNIIVVKSKCGRGMGLEYSKVTTVTDFPAAKIYMSENMPTYKWRYDKESLDGVKKYYRCKGFEKCQKIVYIHMHCDSFECSIFQSNEEHMHPVNSSKIPAQVIELVQQWFKDSITSNKRILEKCREMNFTQIIFRLPSPS